MRFEKIHPDKPRYPYFHIQLTNDTFDRETGNMAIASFLADFVQFLESACPGVRHFFDAEDVFVSRRDINFFVVIRSWFLLRNEVEAEKFYQQWNTYYASIPESSAYICYESTVAKAVVVDGVNTVPFWGMSRTERDYFVGVYQGGDYQDYFYFDDVGEYEQWIQERRMERTKVESSIQEMVTSMDNVRIGERSASLPLHAGEDALLKPLQNLYIGTS